MQNFAINALIHYLLLYVAYRTEGNYSMISQNSVCGGTDDCMNAINDCLLDYYEYDDIEGFEYCFSKKAFGVNNKIIELPNKTEYYEKLYNADGEVDEMKKIYFEFMLNSLKECADNEELYNNLYKYLKLSIYIDENNIGDFDVNIIEDEEVKKIADKLFYIDQFSSGKLFNNYLNDKNGTKFQNFMNKFFNPERKTDYSALYEIINEKYFDNKLENKDVGFILENYNTYNMQTFINESKVNETSLEEFNRNFLMNYDSSIDVVEIVKMMASNKESEHNIFDMIINISKFLKRGIYFRYVYNDNNKNMNTLDINSFYENANTLAEVIYNLIYDYYNYIYDNSQNDKNSEIYRPIYRLKGNELYYILRYGDTIDKLENSDFYSGIYNTIISLENKNKNNAYISKCVTLVKEIYKYYTSDHELKLMEKESIKYDGDDIDYSTDLNKNYNALFIEGTFNYLMENENKDIYKNDLINYITNSCDNYNNDNENYYFDAISSIRLENTYNSYYMDDSLSITNSLMNTYEEINDQWINPPVTKFMSENEYSDYISSVLYKLIRKETLEDIINKNLNNTLFKRAENGTENIQNSSIIRIEENLVELKYNGFKLDTDAINNLDQYNYLSTSIREKHSFKSDFKLCVISCIGGALGYMGLAFNTYGGNHFSFPFATEEIEEQYGNYVDDIGNIFSVLGITVGMYITNNSLLKKNYIISNINTMPSYEDEIKKALSDYSEKYNDKKKLKIGINKDVTVDHNQDFHDDTQYNEFINNYTSKLSNFLKKCKLRPNCKVPKSLENISEVNDIRDKVSQLLNKNPLNKCIDINDINDGDENLNSMDDDQLGSVIDVLAKPIATKVSVDLAVSVLDYNQFDRIKEDTECKDILDRSMKFTMKTDTGTLNDREDGNDDDYIEKKLFKNDSRSNTKYIEKIESVFQQKDFLNKPFQSSFCYLLEDRTHKRDDKVCRSGRKNKGKLKKC